MATLSVRSAKRLQQPSLRDSRLIVGVLLVLLSMLLAALAFRAMDRRENTYVAAHPLTAGDTVSADDLRVERVALGGAQELYLTPATALSPGSTVLSAVAEGQLVPRAAVGTADQVKVRPVPIKIDPIYTDGLTKGSVVTLRASLPAGKEGTLSPPKELLERVTVANVPKPDGSLGGANQTTSITLLVPVDKVADVLAADAVDKARLSVIAIAAPGASK